jgi:transposase InsO family protein
LMRNESHHGVRRAKNVRTTTRDDIAAGSPDLVERNFRATPPNELWVTDLTYVPTSQ